MAWNTINHSCGHVTSVQLYGKMTEREKRVSWLETTLCPDCYKAEKEKERAIELELAKEKAEKESLPELKGSEKQIAWAESIRRTAIDKIGQKESTIEKCKTENLAKWFIDNRNAF